MTNPTDRAPLDLMQLHINTLFCSDAAAAALRQ